MDTIWSTRIELAARDGRIPPGNGPLYTRRVLPAVTPATRTSLLACGATRTVLDRHFITLTRGVIMLRPGLTPAALAADTRPVPGASALRQVLPHGRGDDPAAFRFDGVSRARGHSLIHPGAVVSHWQALGLHGVPHWSDSAPVVLLSSASKVRNRAQSVAAGRNPTRPVFRVLPEDLDPVFPDPLFPSLPVVPGPTAAAQCLATLVKRTHGWWTPHIPGFRPEEVRAVQLLDSLWQATVLTGPEVVDACRGTVDRRLVERLVAVSDQGAQSPAETALRLVVAPLLPAGLTWTSQVRACLGDRSTVLDLACEELRVGLYYDGAHHTADGQRLTDIEQYQDLRDDGWEVLRVDAGLLHRRRAKLLRQLGRALERAQDRR